MFSTTLPRSADGGVCRAKKGDFLMRTLSKISALLAGAAMTTFAATAASADDKVSGDAGISYNSHFVSYGTDVWGGGDKFFGDNSTTFAYGNVYLQATDELQIYGGVWADINSNVPSAIGGKLQEIDLTIGAAYALGPVTLGAAYGSWNYAGDTEEVVDLSIGFNDSDLMPIAFNPKFTYHMRVGANGGQGYGSALVFSVAPSFTLDEDCGITLAIPAGVAFFFNDFAADDGYGYSYVGGSLGVPLSFIPSDYGTWSVNFDVTGYFTSDKALPWNPKENFVTGSVGLKLAF